MIQINEEAGIINKRLTNVKTYVGSTLVRDYKITYDTGGVNSASRITMIEECDGTPTIPLCLAPTTFAWEDTDGSAPSSFNMQIDTGSSDLFWQHSGNGIRRTQATVQCPQQGFRPVAAGHITLREFIPGSFNYCSFLI